MLQRAIINHGHRMLRIVRCLRFHSPAAGISWESQTDFPLPIAVAVRQSQQDCYSRHRGKNSTRPPPCWLAHLIHEKSLDEKFSAPHSKPLFPSLRPSFPQTFLLQKGCFGHAQLDAIKLDNETFHLSLHPVRVIVLDIARAIAHHIFHISSVIRE